MATYQYRYSVIALGAGKFRVIGPLSNINYIDVANGSYDIGGNITQVVYQTSGSPKTITGKLAGYLSDGFVSSSVYTTNEVVVANDTITVSTTGTFVVCFLEGTRIACPEGERAVESLAIGDLVLTATGEARPVRWIGRQTLPTLFADPARSHPVRIRAGALGNGLPRRDLFVSPSHALLVEGVLVQAQALVNGTSIAQVRPEGQTFTYFHLEFEAHTLLLAEGAPTESFCDSNEARGRFDNAAEFAALYGADATGPEPCDLPRITSRRQIPARLAARLAATERKTAQPLLLTA